jgi:predicted kinase
VTKIIVTRGLPGSGKTTLAKAWVAEEPDRRARVNRDDIRAMLFGKPAGQLTHGDEEVVTRAEESLVRAALKEGRDVIVDAMHLRARYVKRWEKIAPVELLDCVKPVAECIQADELRVARGERGVGVAVITELAQRFGIPAHGALPAYELNPELHLQTTPGKRGSAVPWKPAPAWNPDLPDAWIVDTDGTVADLSHRSPYAKDAALYSQDGLFENVARLVALLQDSAYIIGVSGRSEEFRAVTEQWWLERVRVRPDEFHFRSLADAQAGTPDDIVKANIFDTEIAGRYNIVGILDDRPRVLRMWRAKGLTTFAVGDTDHDF